MKTHEVVFKMTIQVFKNVPQFSAKLQQNLKFSETILKVHPIKRENSFQKLIYISFVKI